MKKLTALLLALMLTVMMLTGCSQSDEVLTDASGAELDLPETIESIISLSPSETEIIVALGLGDLLVAVDTYSAYVEGVPSDVVQFDMMDPDIEAIMALDADLIFTTILTSEGGDDVFATVKEAGQCVVTTETATSLDDIIELITFIGAATDTADAAEEITTEMEETIAEYAAIAETITETKTVYFEISTSPYCYTTGANSYIDDIFTLIGAENVFSDMDGWISVSDESIIEKNPDVIITNVNWIDEPIAEIASRDGWANVTAVLNGDIYQVDANSTSRGSQNILSAIEEIAKAVYPDYY